MHAIGAYTLFLLPTYQYKKINSTIINTGFFSCIDYLEASSIPDTENKETSKLFKNIATEAEGKIFHDESHDHVKVETKCLEEIIEVAKLRCKKELEIEEHSSANLLVKDTANFYKKLFCLLNGVQEYTSARCDGSENFGENPAVTKPNVFDPSISSVEKGVSERVRELVAISKQREAKYHEALSKYENERTKLRAKIDTLRKSLTETEEILNDISTEYCELKAEIEKIKREAFFKEVPQLNQSTSSTSDRQIITEESSSRAELSLANVPSDTVERELHNNYKLLLLQISQMLLRDQKVKLRSWAASNYFVETSDDVYQILAKLDEKGIISSSNLTVLKAFFEEITRIDLVLIIENFLAGDYNLLKNVQSSRKENNGSRSNMAPTPDEGRPFGTPPPVTSESSNPRISSEKVAIELKVALRHDVSHEQSQPARGQLVAESSYYHTGNFVRTLTIKFYDILVSTYRDKIKMY